jgi:hypothetical protein
VDVLPRRMGVPEGFEEAFGELLDTLGRET